MNSHVNFSTKQIKTIIDHAIENKLVSEEHGTDILERYNGHTRKIDMYTNFHVNTCLMYFGFKVIGVEGCFSHADVKNINEMFNNWLADAHAHAEDRYNYTEEINQAYYERRGY